MKPSARMMLLYGENRTGKNRDQYRDHELDRERYRDYGRMPREYERERYPEREYRHSDRREDWDQDYEPRRRKERRERYRDDDEDDYYTVSIKDHVDKMRNEDGTTGAHWTQEQTEGVRKSRGIDCDPESFWAAMCMMYSDYHGVMQKFGVDRAEVYAELAKAFLCDKDSKQGREKLESYFECVSK